jgi:uncharacterized protein YeaO (DUF488 family)
MIGSVTRPATISQKMHGRDWSTVPDDTSEPYPKSSFTLRICFARSIARLRGRQDTEGSFVLRYGDVHAPTGEAAIGASKVRREYPWSFELLDWEVKEPLAKAFALGRFVVRRGVFRAEFAARNWYDVWFPNLAPSVGTEARAGGQDTCRVERIHRKYRAEMTTPDNSHAIELLCRVVSSSQLLGRLLLREPKARCHRSILRALLAEKGADVE